MSFPYSLKLSLGTIVLMLVLMLMVLRGATRQSTVLDWVVYAVFGFVFIMLIALLVFYRLIPALRKDIALVFDDEGISDYIGDVSIPWANIADIKLMKGRSAASLQVDLKWVSDHGSTLTIPLRWVEGKDKEIFAEAISILHKRTRSTGEETR